MSAEDRNWTEKASEIDWMLQDTQVSDANLGEALARMYFTELHRLACALLSPNGNPTPAARQAAEEDVLEALAQVVARRDQLWRYLSLRAWLARLVFITTEKQKKTFLKVSDPTDPSGLQGPARADTGSTDGSSLSQAIANMGRLERQAMIFHEVYGLGEGEIAWVLRILPVATAYYIRKARTRLLRRIRENQDAQLQTGEGSNLQTLQFMVQALYPADSVPEADISFYTVDIRRRSAAWRARRGGSVFWREIMLIGIVLGGVFFLCRSTGLLPEEIIYIKETPTSFAKEARPMSRPTPLAPFYYQYRVKYGDTLESVARQAGVSALDILLLNPFNHWPGRGFMLDYGDLLMLPAGSTGASEIILPTAAAPTKSPPLTIQSGRAAILQRMRDSRLYWRSLWAAVQELETGPAGYLGPPLASLQGQIWAVQPDHYMLLYRSDADPDAVQQRLYLAGAYFWSGPGPGELYADFGEEYAAGFLEYFTIPETIPAEDRLVSIQMEVAAGRQALVVDQIRPDGRPASRFWVDILTGVILRWMEYSLASPEIVQREKVITAIAYDQEFPAEIFQPNQQRPRQFASDFHGRPLPAGQVSPTDPEPWPENGHASLPLTFAPEGLDPGQLPLSLQWPDRWDMNQVIIKLEGTALTVLPRIQVFASSYYLGSLPLKDVTFLACRRSPDGRRVALAVGNQPATSSGKLVWFSLDSPQDIHPVYNLSVGESIFAFSPDNRHLAFLGCSPQLGRCSVFTQNLETGDQTDLGTPNDYPESLIWSPDGKRLAVVMTVFASEPYRTIHVVDLEKMLEVYYGKYQEDMTFLDTTAHPWELRLPPQGDIETGCRMP